MPRNVNPKNIKLGSGQTVPDRGAEVGLDAGAATGGGGGGDASLVLAALKAHIIDPKDAHNSSAISIEPFSPFVGDDIESLSQEIGGGMPYEPPKFGQYSRYVDFHCIPDWGSLKLNDTPIFLRDGDFDDLVNLNSSRDTFPYFLAIPSPTIDFTLLNYNVGLTESQDYSPGFTPSNPWVTPEFDGQVQNSKYDIALYGTMFPEGADVFADRLFNYPTVLGADNPFSGYESGGSGRCYSGGFTRTDGEVQKTFRIMENGLTGAEPWPMLATISGCVYPADRGVLALLHFPHLSAPTSTDPWSDQMKSDFLSQDLLDRCIAALLLGQGVLGDACIGDGSVGASGTCDGECGGIFGPGVDDEAEYDPFAFPGRASGQYNLKELHSGISLVTPAQLPEPWNHLTGQTLGAKREDYVATGNYYPAAGQVRLGSDADTNGGVILQWGVPVLGGTDEAYDGVITGFSDYPAIGELGNSAIHDSNFFKYRLPTLDDYSDVSGIKYTPQSPLSPLGGEGARYFYATGAVIPDNTPYDYGTTTTSNFDTAGNYPPFQQDCITWQVARYRHTFALNGTESVSSPLGSYAMMHFKSERDFEAFVEEGVVPEEYYGIHFLTDHSNVVNDYLTETTDPVYTGVVPGFGWGSRFFNGIKNEVFVGGAIDSHEVNRAGDIVTNEFTWSATGIAGSPGYTMISGIGYFTPIQTVLGATCFWVDSVDVEVDNAWVNGYRTDSATATGTPPVDPPALENSPDPGSMNFKPFTSSVAAVPLPVSYPGDFYRHDYQVEFPFTYLGSNGGGVFSLTNGPATVDALVISNSDPIALIGDDNPSFSVNAKPWFYIRRPLTHGVDWENVIQPAWTEATGHGFDLLDAGGDTILFHSTGFYCDDIADETTGHGEYGNFVSTNITTTFTIDHYPAFDSLMTAEKDVEERFLDEIYRHQADVDLSSITAPYKPIFLALRGPGMGTWNSGLVPVPVQAGKYSVAADFPAPWDTLGLVLGSQVVEAINNLSWTQLEKNQDTLKDSELDNELQVCGLPPRNPPVLDWAEVPYPSAGLLRYPAIDYTALPIRPDNTDVTAVTLLDYSGSYGAYDKNYVRFFDAAFSRWSSSSSTPPVDAAGQPFVTFRIDGITLEDLTYVTPGPGTITSGGFPAIAFQVKVPGLTTWMDAGRPDGSGPSKQDLDFDGAGCQVIGQHTFDSIDSETGMVYCQIMVNVGPFANLGTGISSGVAYEVPVGVKVTMAEMVAEQYDLTANFDGSKVGAGVAASEVRGITGIKIVHPTEVETAPTS